MELTRRVDGRTDRKLVRWGVVYVMFDVKWDLLGSGGSEQGQQEEEGEGDHGGGRPSSRGRSGGSRLTRLLPSR